MKKGCLVILVGLVTAAAAPEGASQGTSASVEIHAEALAVGAELTLPVAAAWSVGGEVSVGKHLSVAVTDAGAGLDTYATGYLALRWTPDAAWQVVLSPIGFAVVVGNDFGTAYPSARLGMSRFLGHWGIGTEVRVVRIAGGGGSGDYWIQWAPVRLAVRL